MTTYEVSVTLPEASLQILRSQVTARQGLVQVQDQLQATIHAVSDSLGKALEAAKAELESLGHGYADELIGYVEEMDVRPKLSEELTGLLEHGYFHSSDDFGGAVVYNFVEEFVEVAASFESEQFPRIAKADPSPRLWEYNPQTDEVLLKTELYFDDRETDREIEHNVYIKLKLAEDGPYSVVAEVE